MKKEKIQYEIETKHDVVGGIEHEENGRAVQLYLMPHGGNYGNSRIGMVVDCEEALLEDDGKFYYELSPELAEDLIGKLQFALKSIKTRSYV